MIVLVTMKYQPRWLYWLLPIYTGLVFAAVYGRFHYALDVFAGWALAFAVVGMYRMGSFTTEPRRVTRSLA